MIKNCQARGCKICGKWHHTLIHRNKDLSGKHSNGSQNLSQQQEKLQATYHALKITCELCATGHSSNQGQGL